MEVHFIGIQDVERADGQSITQETDNMMREVCREEEWQAKLVVYATDGALVRTGAHKGVVSRLRGNNMHVLGIHCTAHRLELAFKVAIKSCSLAKQFEDMLSGLCTFYCKSTHNRANLKQSFNMMGQKLLLPTRIGGTRWVSHLFRAIDLFLRGYP